MLTIEADNPEIEKEVRRLLALITEGGGGVHSNLVIRSQNGGLSIETKVPMAPGKEMMRIPKGALLSAAQFEVAVNGDGFDVSFPAKSAFTPLQRKLAECMFSLYTLTHKARLHREGGFMLAMAEHEDLLAKITNVRQLGRELLKYQEDIKSGLQGAALDKVVADTFMKTRFLGYNDKEKFSSSSVLMPVIDFLNHHWAGAGFAINGGVRTGDISVGCSQPVEGSLECYAFYGVMDPLDALIRYDFIDALSPVIRSVPLEIAVPDAGTIIIQGRMGAKSTKKLPKQLAGLNRFVPALEVDRDAGRVSASHLLIPVEKSPRALRRVLTTLFLALRGNAGDMTDGVYIGWLRDAERQVIEENKKAYRALHDAAEKAKSAGRSYGPEQLQRACAILLDGLERYVFLAEAEEAAQIEESRQTG